MGPRHWHPSEGAVLRRAGRRTPYVNRAVARSSTFASEQAFIGYALLPHYTAAKAGLLTLTRSLALASDPTILVNAVLPRADRHAEDARRT